MCLYFLFNPLIFDINKYIFCIYEKVAFPANVGNDSRSCSKPSTEMATRRHFSAHPDTGYESVRTYEPASDTRHYEKRWSHRFNKQVDA